jgi:hypothetical protein
MAGDNEAMWRFGDHTVRVSHLNKLYWPEDGLTKGTSWRITVRWRR